MSIQTPTDDRSLLRVPRPRFSASHVPALLQTQRQLQFRSMELALRAHGGIATSSELTVALQTWTAQPVSMLAHWIVDGEVVSFQWASDTMLPMFQFALTPIAPRRAVTEVLRELNPIMSEWEVALWFTEPNAGLQGAAPVGELAREPQKVLDAARAHRFWIRG